MGECDYLRGENRSDYIIVNYSLGCIEEERRITMHMCFVHCEIFGQEGKGRS